MRVRRFKKYPPRGPDFMESGQSGLAGESINKNAADLKAHGIFNWLPRLVDFRNWLMTSGEMDVIKILTKELPVIIS